MDDIRLLLFAVAPRYRSYGKSSGGIVVERDFKSRFDSARSRAAAPSARVRSLSLFFFPFPRACYRVAPKGERKKEGRSPSRPHRFLPSLFAPSSYFSGRIFAGRHLARAATGYQWSGSVHKLPATGFNLQVGLFRASETRDGHRERATACSLTGNSQFPANSAISCCVCPLCNPACGDAIFRPSVSGVRPVAERGGGTRRGPVRMAWPMQPNRNNEFDECGGAFQ